MSMGIKGNTSGLAPSEARRIQKLGDRKISSQEIISFELARELYKVSSELKRRIGLLISREGRIEEVIVGSRDILYLPELGRYRLGKGRLRRLRLVFADLSHRDDHAHIPSDIYTDLEKLRLDAVVSVKDFRNRLMISYAYILPASRNNEMPVRTEHVADLGQFNLDFRGFIEDLENELSNADHGKKGGGAFLVGVYDKSIRDPESRISELESLTRTAGMQVAGKIIQRRAPDPKTLLGKGKLEELLLQCIRLDAEMIIFDGELKPSQWRVITNSTEIKVLDRSMLILDIFAQRAQSSEGRLQVELAQLRYNLPKLVEKDAGLSRLTGGIGGRGPGETKLEIGRRRIRDRISFLDKKIDELSRQRQLRRSRREENQIPLVSLIGYTNAGKSSLFNALTKSKVFVEDKLFATLDPAQRRMVLPYEGAEGWLVELVLADTVGFIRDLPEELRNAFRATLEEIRGASLLVHILDGSDTELLEKKVSVEGILKEMELSSLKSIVAVNKVDELSESAIDHLRAELGAEAIFLSALSRRGLGELRTRMEEILREEILKAGIPQ